MPELLETLIENRAIVQLNHANSLGTAHGGNVLKLMDEIGALSAIRVSSETSVTAMMGQVNYDTSLMRYTFMAPLRPASGFAFKRRGRSLAPATPNEPPNRMLSVSRPTTNENQFPFAR